MDTCTVSTMSESVEVREEGRALQVHTDTPHLVSLGGGRLSTAVTLHPLCEGRITLGSAPGVDICVQGTGVEPIHCHIENNNGVVMLYPVAEMTAIDGLTVSTPTRLTQGCMLCIGRSNYLRFNHPAEARLMKSILPNTRISMVPLAFCTGAHSAHGDAVDSYLPLPGQLLDKKPPMAPRRSPRDSWGEVSTSSSEECCILGKVSKFEYLSQNYPRTSYGNARHLSPKVFPPGSSTVSSPASAVLGTNHSLATGGGTSHRTFHGSPSASNGMSNGIQLRSRSATPTNASFSSTNVNGNVSRSQSSTPTVGIQTTPTSHAPASCGSAALVTYENIAIGCSTPRSSDNSGMSEFRSITTPSPSFNRNPQPYSQSAMSGYHGITPSPASSFRSISPSPAGHRRIMSVGRVTSPTPSFGSTCSVEELNARKEELELRRRQAQEERLREQEAERVERARLEEILTMCAEYERQNKPPTTPTIHQNRIKTNGSLPRDKRLPSPSSTPACMSASDDELADIFTFDLSTATVSSLSATPNTTGVTVPALSGLSASVTASSAAGTVRSPYENVVVGAPGSVVYPQSPRTRIRTILPSVQSPNRDMCEAFENRLALSSDYDFVNSLPRNKSSKAESSAVTDNGVGPDGQGKFILPLDGGSPDEMAANEQAAALTAAADGDITDAADAKIKDGISKPEMEDSKEVAENMSQAAEGKQELKKQTRRKNSRDEGESKRKERGKLLATLSGIKRKITEIEQQEEELSRGLEMERALLEGEWQAQKDKLTQDEERLSSLQDRAMQLDRNMESSRKRELQRQTECRIKLEAADAELRRLEQEVLSCAGNPDKQKEVADKLQHQHEVLEAERKLFEDLEFHHLEEEAGCLAGREELQRELSDICTRVHERKIRLQELEQQRLEAAQAAKQEQHALECQLLNQLHRLEEATDRLHIVESQLEDLVCRGIISNQESSPDASSDADEPIISMSRMRTSMNMSTSTNTKQSQDDLDRISRVTMGAPLEMSTGSLGRRTLASLQEIERNRQLHLVQQGSQVIEEERKRVQELKRRVQDEVRAEWEERRQREANCTSLNSVGSDETSLTSSDVPTESASSDDAVDKRNSVPANTSGGTDDKNDPEPATPQLQDNVREKELELERDFEETRPLSDGSSYEHQLAVRMREKAARLQQQRPLTRYLPIRSESLNLRHHIESAGHQIELCPHVWVDTTSCRGFLHKMGSKFHHWNKRWFVFDRTKRTLTYYGDRSEKKPRGGMYFQSIEEVYVDHLNSVKSPNPQLTFIVKTVERTYHLMAPSAEAMRIWVDVVFTGAEGYQEFEPGT